MPRIISWNTQGDCIAALSLSYNTLLSNRNDNIIMIQEAGNVFRDHEDEFPITFGSKDRGGHSFNAYLYEQYGAKNKRCTTGMLIEDGYSVQKVSCLEYSGKRPIVACECSYEFPGAGWQSFLFATVHATANEHIAQKELLEINERFRKYN